MERRSALLISSSEYQDASLTRLFAPQNDVQALAEVLRDACIGGFEVKELLINKASSVVREAIADFFAEQKRDDLALLYFSGHGLKDDLNSGKLYLTATDTRRDRLRATGIAASFLLEEVEESKSRRIILILDCCFSGAFARGSKGADDELDAAFKNMGYGRFVLTASKAHQPAWEEEKTDGAPVHSVFTKFLLEGIRTGAADLSQSGKITVADLYEYVHDQFQQMDGSKGQVPGIWCFGKEGKELVIANNSFFQSKPLPKEMQAAVDSPLAEVRLASVSTLKQLLNSPERGLAQTASDALQKLADDDSRKVSGAAASVMSSFCDTRSKKSEPLRGDTKSKSKRLQQTAAEKQSTSPQKDKAKQFYIFVSGFLAACLCAWLLSSFQNYRDFSYCSATESDASSIAAAIADYFAIPSHTTLGPVPILVGPNAGIIQNGIEFPALSGMNTGKITGDVSVSSGIIISVQDASGRCPVKYQQEYPNNDEKSWNGSGTHIMKM